MWFVGAFDAVLELVIFGRQKLDDLIISGSYVAKRRPISNGLPNLKLMAAHVASLQAEPQARCIPRLGPEAGQREAGESPFVVPPRGNRSMRRATAPS
jgi:hypothetical protein